jgi:hypothetical protein
MWTDGSRPLSAEANPEEDKDYLFKSTIEFIQAKFLSTADRVGLQDLAQACSFSHSLVPGQEKDPK